MIFLILSTLITYCFGQSFINFLSKHNIVDSMSKEGNHTKTTARGGGLFIVGIPLLMFVIEHLIFRHFISHELIPLDNAIKEFIILGSLSLMLCIIFFFEDWIGIHYFIRLIMQFVFSYFLYLVLKNDITLILNRLFIPQCLHLILFVFVAVWMMNLYNFMDGIDLITVTETISILTGALLLIIIGINKIYFYGEDYDQLRILIKFILYLMSGMLIFIRFNSPPAKLFLGDSGSIVLGAVMMIILIKITKNFGVIPTLLLPLYYIIDSGMTLVKRISRKENVFLPNHGAHFFQIAKRGGISSNVICLKILCTNVILIVLSLLASSFEDFAFVLLLIGMSVVFYLISKFSSNNLVNNAK